MTYGITDCFMISAVCGFIFGIVYELFRCIRTLCAHNPVVTFVCDICFFISAAFIVLDLSLYLGNYVRIYTLLGFGAGVFAYINTLGRIMRRIEMLIFTVCNNTIGRVFRAIYATLSATIGAFAHKTAEQFGKIHDFLFNRQKKASSLLHFDSDTMYNSKREKIAIGESSRGNHVIKAKITRGS